VLFLLIHLTLKIVISKIKPPLQVVIIAATKKKTEKKSNPILYIHFNFGGNDKKKGKKKTICFGAL